MGPSTLEPDLTTQRRLSQTCQGRRSANGNRKVDSGQREARGEVGSLQERIVVLSELDPDPVTLREAPAVAVQLEGDRTGLHLGVAHTTWSAIDQDGLPGGEDIVKAGIQFDA